MYTLIYSSISFVYDRCLIRGVMYIIYYTMYSDDNLRWPCYYIHTVTVVLFHTWWWYFVAIPNFSDACYTWCGDCTLLPCAIDAQYTHLLHDVLLYHSDTLIYGCWWYAWWYDDSAEICSIDSFCYVWWYITCLFILLPFYTTHTMEHVGLLLRTDCLLPALVPVLHSPLFHGCRIVEVWAVTWLIHWFHCCWVPRYLYHALYRDCLRWSPLPRLAFATATVEMMPSHADGDYGIVCHGSHSGWSAWYCIIIIVSIRYIANGYSTYHAWYYSIILIRYLMWYSDDMIPYTEVFVLPDDTLLFVHDTISHSHYTWYHSWYYYWYSLLWWSDDMHIHTILPIVWLYALKYIVIVIRVLCCCDIITIHSYSCYLFYRGGSTIQIHDPFVLYILLFPFFVIYSLLLFSIDPSVITYSSCSIVLKSDTCYIDVIGNMILMIQYFIPQSGIALLLFDVMKLATTFVLLILFKYSIDSITLIPTDDGIPYYISMMTCWLIHIFDFDTIYYDTDLWWYLLFFYSYSALLLRYLFWWPVLLFIHTICYLFDLDDHCYDMMTDDQYPQWPIPITIYDVYLLYSTTLILPLMSDILHWCLMYYCVMALIHLCPWLWCTFCYHCYIHCCGGSDVLITIVVHSGSIPVYCDYLLLLEIPNDDDTLLLYVLTHYGGCSVLLLIPHYLLIFYSSDDILLYCYSYLLLLMMLNCRYISMFCSTHTTFHVPIVIHLRCSVYCVDVFWWR